MANATAREQLMLELINRARMDPLAEAARQGIDLNQDLSPGTITAAPKQVMAMNDALILAARNHSNYMLINDDFAHDEKSSLPGYTGQQPFDRMIFAGYVFTGTWRAGENISVIGRLPSVDLDQVIYDQHRNLFLSSSHRENMLDDRYREAGIGQQHGTYTAGGTDWDASMITQNFALSGTKLFVTGVVYNDTVVANDFYDIGEGLAGVSASSGSVTDTTGAGGGYELALDAGMRTVTVGGVTIQLTLTTSNQKVDVVNTTEVWSDRSFNVIAGVTYARLYGIGAHDIRGASGSETIVGNSAANVLDGGTGGNDTLYGEGGDDTLKAWSGADVFYGGAGTDTLSFEGWSSGVNIRLDVTTVQAVAGGSIRIPLLDIENVTGGNGNDTLRGNSGNNTLNGGNGNDTLQAWAGHDIFIGGAGTDTLTFAGWGSGVTVSLGTLAVQSVSGGSVKLGFLDIENLTGGNGNDILTGSGQANVISGGARGNDTLDGAGGNDTLLAWTGDDVFIGGAGSDTLSFQGWSVGVNIRLDVSTAQTVAGGSVRIPNLDIENLVGGNGNDTLRGNNGNNEIDGGAGNDTLQAWSGIDIFYGGAGNDTLSFAGWTSAVTVNLNSHLQQAVSGGSIQIPLKDIENVTGGNGSDTLYGNTEANILAGGLGGNDTLYGFGGDDTFKAWSGHDTFYGGPGYDTVDFSGWGSGVTLNLGLTTAQAVAGGSVTLDSIENVIGGNGADTFIGTGVDNTFTGGLGRDTYTGGAGADRFVFRSAAEVGLTLATADTITDFDDLDIGGDVIDLSAIDAITGGGHDVFDFLATEGQAFFAPGQIRWYTSGGDTIIEGNTTGDATPEFVLRLTGIKTLVAGDFIL